MLWLVNDDVSLVTLYRTYLDRLLESIIDVTPHPWNTSFDWVDTGRADFDRDGYVVVDDLIDADHAGRRRRPRPTGSRPRSTPSCAGLDDGRLSIAETGAITFATHLVARSDGLRALSRHRRIVGPVRRADRARRQPLLGPGRVQEAGEAPPVPVAPGQRLRLRRAPAVPHRVARPHRRDASTTAAPGSCPGCTGRARCAHTYVDPLGWECLSDPAGAVAASGAGRRGRGVLVAHAPPHRSQHHRRGAQGLHPPVRPGRRRGAARRPGGRAARAPGAGRRARPPVPRPPRRRSPECRVRRRCGSGEPGASLARTQADGPTSPSPGRGRRERRPGRRRGDVRPPSSR